jgi:NAD(P)H-hydrate epimerase
MEGWPVVTVDEMRALEAGAAAAGISEQQLQANAASEIALVAGRIAPDTTRVVVLVGPGNNGRDAFLAGRLLAERGRRVFYYLSPRHSIAPDELDSLQAPSERAQLHQGEADLEILKSELGLASAAIDGLLGIGVHGPMRPPLDGLTRALNEVRSDTAVQIISVDVPSGIDADTGQVAGEAVRADVTVALGGVKAGLLRFPAASFAGTLEPRPIGLPPGADADCRVRLLGAEMVASLVPTRPLDAHKGTLGWVLVVGGSRDYVGAPVLSAAGAARSGCGLVALAAPPNVQASAAAMLPEATYLLREPEQAPALEAERVLDRLLDFRAIVVGPGLGRDEAGLGLARSLLGGLHERDQAPAVVIDADALYALAQWPDWWSKLPSGCVLTPHHGEMARLTGQSVEAVAARNWETALEHAARWQQIVVLKGPHTVVAEPSGSAWVYPRPNPALATAGSGDVLAGLIAGLAAQGLAPLEASRLAVVTHALAAERVQLERQWRTLIASDLLPAVPRVLRELARC